MTLLRDLDQPFVFELRGRVATYRLEFSDTSSPENWQLLRPDIVIICYDISQRLSLINMQRIVRTFTAQITPPNPFVQLPNSNTQVDQTSPPDLPDRRINPPRPSPRPQARPPLRVRPERHHLPARRPPGRPGDARRHVHGMLRADGRAPAPGIRRHLPTGHEDRLLRRRAERWRLHTDVTGITSPNPVSSPITHIFLPTVFLPRRRSQSQSPLSPALDRLYRLLAALFILSQHLHDDL
jgi:hypothetical protein